MRVYSGGSLLDINQLRAQEAIYARGQGLAVDHRLREALTATPKQAHKVLVRLRRQASESETRHLADTVAGEIVQLGGTVHKHKRSWLLPATLPETAIQQLAVRDDILNLWLDAPVETVDLSSDAPRPFTQADLLSSLLNGSGQNIGLLEASSNFCRLFNEHLMFSASPTPILANVAFTPCGGAPLICNMCNGTAPSPGGACHAGTCVATHPTAVASVIAQVAPAAQIYYANVPGMAPVTYAGIVDAFDYFRDNSVKIVNQSFQAMTPGAQGIVEDDLARTDNVLVVQSSGNSAGEPGSISEACRDNSNALCVGAHTNTFERSCFSNWKNPTSGSGVEDREEPDILGFGGQGSPRNGPEECVRSGATGRGVTTAGTKNTSATSTPIGTSFAAPAAAAAAAILQQECTKTFGQPVSALALRSLLMIGAQRNSSGYRYSTPNFNVSGGPLDAQDGAGVLSLLHTVPFCSDSPGNHSFNEIVVDPNGGDEMPNARSSFNPEDPPPQSSTGLELSNLSEPGGSSARRGMKLNSHNFVVGDRYRVVASWNSCRASPGSDSMFATPDFDLFLLHWDGTLFSYRYASQSFRDNNEGFDITIPAGWGAGSYELWLSWLPSAVGQWECLDSPGGEPIVITEQWGTF